MPGITRTFEISVQDHRLQYLSMASRHGSMRAASDYLGVAPSTISRQIKLLEKALSINLVEKGSHKMVLTEAGQMLCSYYEKRSEDHSELLSALATLRNIRTQTIRIVSTEGLLVSAFLSAFKTMCEKHQDASIELTTIDSMEAQLSIISEAAHFGLLLDMPGDVRLRTHAQCPQPFYALIPKKHKLARHSKLTPELISPEKILMPPVSSRLFEIVQTVFADRNLPLNIVLKSVSMQLILKGVESGLGLALLPKIIAEGNLNENILAKPVDCPELDGISLQLVSKAGRLLSPPALSLLKSLEYSVTHLERAS